MKNFLKYLFSFIILVSVAVVVWLIFLYSQVRFSTDKIINYTPKLTTQFYDRNGILLANYFDDEHRLYVKYDKIPARVIESLVAVEDTLFFEHNGVNLDAILRAIIKDIKARKFVEGASTLTQQLIKISVLTSEKKLIRKIKEALLAMRLETLLSKEEIIERYLNQVYFGHGYYGIKTASLGYFGKELSQLNLKEIAMLVGLPKAPSYYDPTKKIVRLNKRANKILYRLNTLGWCSKEELSTNLKYKPKVYSRDRTQNIAPYVVDTAIKQLAPDLEDLKSGGYQIYLTIDYEAQKIARKALKMGYDKIKARDEKRKKWQNAKDINKTNADSVNGALISLENQTGKILALVGGVDYNTSSFNRVTQIQRQPGSAAKPFLYQVALNLGYSPATLLTDISRSYDYKDKNNEEKKWQPKNYEKNFKGRITLRDALVHSRNLATINMVTDIGIDIMHKRLREFGFKDIPYDLSITLGSFGISPWELSELYTIISNQGVKIKPYLIDRVVDKYDQSIVFDTEEQYVVPKEQSFLLTTILRDVVKKGTGRRARVKGLEIAGKTGTTNNNIDAWFCGFSPTIQTLVWFGNDDNSPMNRTEVGGRAAGPVFAQYYTEYYKNHSEMQKRFIQPPEVNKQLFGGKYEYFTPISKPPKEVVIPQEKVEDENVVF
jgi:penicillin-binding protein 1A